MGLTLATIQQCIKLNYILKAIYLPQKSLPLDVKSGAGQLPAESSPETLEKSEEGREQAGQKESPAT